MVTGSRVLAGTAGSRPQLGEGAGHQVPGQLRALSLSGCWVMPATPLTTPGLCLSAVVGHPQQHLPRFPQKAGLSIAVKKVKMGVEMPCVRGAAVLIMPSDGPEGGSPLQILYHV